jgi:hypothetical protein
MTDEQLIEKYGTTPEPIEGAEYELAIDGTISLNHLMDLNLAGYVYTSHIPDVDFEDEDEDGNLITCYMDIYYFTKINPDEQD